MTYMQQLLNLQAGNTPVLVAVDTNNTELLQLLVACGANVNQFKVCRNSKYLHKWGVYKLFHLKFKVEGGMPVPRLSKHSNPIM